MTDRLRAVVERDFGPRSDEVVAALERADLGPWQSTQPPLGRERVLAAVLAIARGDVARIPKAIQIAEHDWRDALVWGGLGQPDWPRRLDELLDPAG
jgi:hypothetical protein